MKYELRQLSAQDGRDIYDMLQKLPAHENGYSNSVNGMSFEEYKAWLKAQELSSKRTELEDGWKVPQSTFWLYVDGKPVGRGDIRHFLTEKLLQEGGSIGYAIVPGERRKGYGTVLLRELIKECRRLSIARALITVRNENTASIKVALSNGGKIERTSDTRHYIWVDC